MKKIIFALAFSLLFVGVASADTIVCGTQPDGSFISCGNGSPENVVNVWGTTNAQLPHILQGQTVNGEYCPAWFPMYCVDIRGTAWYQSRLVK